MLTGIQGTGKSAVAKAFCNEYAGTEDGSVTPKIIFLKVTEAEILKELLGKTETTIKNLIVTAREAGAKVRLLPVIFIDECDKLFGGSFTNTFKQNFGQSDDPPLVIIAATNYSAKVDKALADRFEEFIFELHSAESCSSILLGSLQSYFLQPDVNCPKAVFDFVNSVGFDFFELAGAALNLM